MGIVLWEVGARAEPYAGIMPIQVITKLLTEDIRPDLMQLPKGLAFVNGTSLA